MLTPAFLLLSLLALPIILLYMLRLRRRRVTVSSTLLWRQLLRDREANAPWQKLRRNLLLFLQLAILALLVFALARPYLPVPTIAGGNSIVLLDASASMQALDGGDEGATAAPTTRFAAAQAEILQQINGLGGNDRMTLVQVGRVPTVLASATNDRDLLRQALVTAQPEAGAADWRAAFALAAGAVQGYRDGQVIVVSDGGLPADLPPLPAALHYIPVGRVAANLAISTLATRNTADGSVLLAQATNYGDTVADALFSLTVDGTLFDSRRITLPAAESVSLTWELPPSAAEIVGDLQPNDPAQDQLPLDNRAFAINQGGTTTRALLITEGNLFLEKLFAILPGVEAYKTAPDSTEAADPDYDLVIYDSVPLPETPPPHALLIINPQPADPGTAETPWLPVTGTFTNTLAVRLTDTPLLQFVDWRNITIQQAQQVEAPWAESLIAAEEGPLLLTGERNGRRIAIFTFDLQQSNLPLQIAFPVIMANIVDWLSPGQVLAPGSAENGSLVPGEAMELLPSASTTALSVIKPDGTIWQTELAADDQDNQPLLFGETAAPGIYQIQVEDATGTRAAGRFAVNLFDPGESQIRPAPSIQVGTETVGDEADSETAGQEELWPWLALLAFLVLLIEWWVFHRGVRWPSLKLP